jgi:hypothetical protein
MINKRLFEHYRIDTDKNLKIKTFCQRPFDTLLVDKMGSCYACECQSWLPQSIGNLQIKSMDQIVDSAMHKHMQQSITDGTYRHCNNKQCSYLLMKDPPFAETIPAMQIKHLRLAIDDSCNLRCPSCRKGLIFHKEGSAYNLGVKLADKINDWLYKYQHPIQVHIGSDGDPFASHVYRHFMDQTPERDNIKYSILTNALMFEDFYPRVPYIVRNLHELGVSIDGASKETYEKLRLGGNWEKINKNLECISKLKKQHNFRFILHFVVQKDNYHEMEDIILLGKKYNADRVFLNKLEDWNVLNSYKQHNIHDPAHPLHQDYQRKLKIAESYIGNDIAEMPTLVQFKANHLQ